MSNLPQAITTICNDLIKKPTSSKKGSKQAYIFHKKLYEWNADVNHEVSYDTTFCSFYADLSANISIKIFKTLGNSNISFEKIGKEASKILNKEAEIILEWSPWQNIKMQKWDIEIAFANSDLSKKINKSGAIIKWENCFLETIADEKSKNLIALELATKEDLEVILMWLKELL